MKSESPQYQEASWVMNILTPITYALRAVFTPWQAGGMTLRALKP